MKTHNSLCHYTILTFTGVYLIQGITARQHFHIRPEFLGKCFDDLTSRRAAANTQTLCSHVTLGVIFKVEAHHTVKLQILPEKQGKKYP